MISAVGFLARYLTAESNVLMSTMSRQEVKEVKIPLRTLWGYAENVITRFTLALN